MRRLALAVTFLAMTTSALGAEQRLPPPRGDEVIPGWAPRKVTREQQDRKEIMSLLASMQAAWERRDAEAAAALVDFPVLMVTDDSLGEAISDVWTRERWLEVMTPAYQRTPDMKVKHKPSIFLMTDSLASVADQETITIGRRTLTARHSMLLVRTKGQWRIKSMVEGGHGDAMRKMQASRRRAAPQQGTGSTGEQARGGSQRQK